VASFVPDQGLAMKAFRQQEDAERRQADAGVAGGAQE
jgi:hypothetical protein